jgi:ABC-2 type transport system permease protein
MNGALYRLEARRLLRTHTFLGLVLLCALAGIGGPVLSYFTEDLVSMADPEMGLVVDLPEATAVDALAGYTELVAPLGTLVLVLMAAASLSVDSSPGRSVFYRSRVSGAADLVLPRFALPALAACAAFLVGALVTWGTTSLLFEPLPLNPTLLGALLTGLYLLMAAALVALVSTLTLSTPATVGFSLLGLVVVLLAGQVPFLSHLGPSGLLHGQAALTAGAPAGEFAPMALVAALLTLLFLSLAIRLSDRREV